MDAHMVSLETEFITAMVALPLILAVLLILSRN